MAMLLPFLAVLAASRAFEPVPLVADFRIRDGAFAEAGGLRARLEGGARVEGGVLRLTGDRPVAVVEGPDLAHRLGRDFTVTAWVRLDSLPPGGQKMTVVTKRTVGYRGTPFCLAVSDRGQLFNEGDNGLGWPGNFGGGPVEVGKWQHLALTWRAGGQGVLYRDGQLSGSTEAKTALNFSTDALVFGFDDSRGARFRGAIREARLFARALTPTEVAADVAGTLATRPATATDFSPPTQMVRLHLVRDDVVLPDRNLREGDIDALTRADAVRRPGPDAVDWPVVTLGERRLFVQTAVEERALPLETGDRMRPLRRQPWDLALNPGDHWLRVGNWFWDRRQVYSTDPTVRGFAAEVELRTYPVRIERPGGTLQEAIVRWNGQEIYRRSETLASLTLLLPACRPAQPYTISVDGESTQVVVGPLPVIPGAPAEIARPVRNRLPNGVLLATPARPDVFPFLAEWESDLQAMTLPLPKGPSPEPSRTLASRVGEEAPRSPVTTYGVALGAGMSSGWPGSAEHMPPFRGTDAKFAAHVRNLGLDEVSLFGGFDSPDDFRFESRLAELMRQGVRGGIILNQFMSPNFGLYSWTLPEYGRSLFRSQQVVAQRLRRWPNFAGFVQGADNAGYVPYWDWAGPIMNRPWMRAMETIGITEIPLGPALNPSKDIERRATQVEFIRFIRTYGATFQGYGRSAAAVSAASPGTAWSTGSFGSGPGVGATGGWPFASIPSFAMHRGVPILQAYDWNEVPSSKPLHAVSLLDRLRSDHPDKPLRAIIDDFGVLFGREARQRAYAMALTRGLSGIGTNFLVHPKAAPSAIAEYRDLFEWVHRYGGTYALSQPAVSVGIVFSHEQAISRPVVGDDRIYEGSHEGKAIEALILCHMAGFPARLVTVDELKRGVPKEFSTLLLAGLNRFDQTWLWSEGLSTPLSAFVKRGGRIVADDESESPVAATRTSLRIAAYIQQSPVDRMPDILRRNEVNVRELRRVLGEPKGLAVSPQTDVWAVPTVAGDLFGVTVLNWGSLPGQNASRVVRGQRVRLKWNVDRPIYDVQLRRRVSVEEASEVDLTHDGFRWFLLPPKPVARPTVVLAPEPGRSFVWVDVAGMVGVPVELSVTRGTESVQLWGASGRPIRVPIRPGDGSGVRVTATELLSGLRSAPVAVPVPKPAPAPDEDTPRWERFLRRTDVPLVIALTPAQAAEPQVLAAVGRWKRALAVRRPTVRRIEPNDVVLGLQAERSDARYPRWRTLDADLVLLGSERENPLVLDLARGRLVDPGSTRPKLILSAFVGDRWTLHAPTGSNPPVRGPVQRTSR